ECNLATVNLRKSVDYVAGLLNATDWKVVQDGIMSGSSAILQCLTSAPFAASDVGKTVTITGAAGSGDTLLSTIASFSSTTTVNTANVATVGVSGATVSYGGRSVDPRHPESVIIEAILEKDLQVCQTILATPNHSRRANFTETISTLANGSLIPSSVGAVSSVEVQHSADSQWHFGREVRYDDLVRWLNNAG